MPVKKLTIKGEIVSKADLERLHSNLWAVNRPGSKCQPWLLVHKDQNGNQYERICTKDGLDYKQTHFLPAVAVDVKESTNPFD